MILYHGSTDLVDKPEIRENDVYLDFGVGFYTTTSFEQAERWAKIKMRRKNINSGYDNTVKKLKTEVLHDQWTLHSNEILKYLKFIEAKEVRQENVYGN